MPRFVLALIVIAAVGALHNGLGLGAGGATFENAIEDGRPAAAPSTVLPVLGHNATTSIASLRGRVVVVNFWASWCGPCNDEAPVLNRAQQLLATRGGTVLGVTYHDSAEASLGFVRTHGVNFPTVRDETGAFARDYGVHGVPETFVIDARGRVVELFRGQVDDAFLERAIQTALASR